ncbi:MAG: tetraacyldisaccharide 4'-kinase [Cyclobacteriaceae bacterium]
MHLSDMLLTPFAILYDGITAFRNKMFDAGLKKSIGFDIPTVVVGNLAVGGTGKTPMIEFLIRKLMNNYQIAVLSRGYGRKTKGFLMANDHSGPEDIGDEPYQVYDKFGAHIKVAVGEERVLAIPMILANAPETEVILLDDAYQHRYLKADLNILLTAYAQPFYKDKLLPSGRLRESKKNADRAGLVVVTKCPKHTSESTKSQMGQQVSLYTKPGIPIIFAGLKYGQPYPMNGKDKNMSESLILVTGIVSHQPILEELAGRFRILKVFNFPDHHAYTHNDILKIQLFYKKYRKDQPSILTTEKDAVKLKDEKFHGVLEGLPLFVLPVEMSLVERDEALLLNMIEDKIKSKTFGSGN